MFTGKQFGILGVVSGANLLLSLLVSTIGGSLGAQGPTGQTGPQGPQGSTGEAGATGADGREVEFDVENNVLVWRYVGDAEWQELDLEVSGGGNTINTSGNGLYSHWIFSANPTLGFDYRSRISVNDSATYAANLIANDGFFGVATLADLEAIDDTQESLAGKYVLTGNIDLSSWTPNTNDNIYNVINGTFTGVFDGAGYGITNMTIDTTVVNLTINRGGLFHTLNGATVQNLNIGNFTFISPQQISSTGVLAGQIDNDYVLIDQVYADNILFKATNQVYQSGGLVGYVNGNVDFVRTVVANAEFQSDGSFYAAGGFYGWVDGYDVGVYETSSQLTINPITPGVQPDADRIGGTGGSHQSGANLIGSKITTSLTGAVDSHSAAFVGNMAGLSKVILQDMTINAQLTQLYTNQGFNNGGVFGFYGRDGLLIMDDITVNGLIEGQYDIGGMIGHAKEGSAIRIANSTSNANIAGDYNLGGVIGSIADNGHKTVLENLTINTNLRLIDVEGDIGQYGNSFGGLIGRIDERDNDDILFTNQTLIENADVTVNFEYEMIPLNNVESRYVDFETFGGMIGNVEMDNDVRIANSTVDMGITFDQTLSSNLENFSFNVYGIGGVVGYIDESDLLIINTLADVDIAFTTENFAPVASNNTSFGFYFYNIGGIVGELDEAQLTLVASEGDLDISVVQSNITSNFLNYNYRVYSTGGIVGNLNNDSIVLGETITGNYALTLTLTNLTVADGNQMNIEVYENAAIIGEADGVALLSDLEYLNQFNLTNPDAIENKITLNIKTTTRPIGTSNPFIFITE